MGFWGRIFKRSVGVEAGAGGRRWEGASALTAPASQTLGARGPAKARASGVYANTPYGQRIVEVWASNLVGGKGWQARPQYPDPEIRRSLAEGFEALFRPLMLPLARGLVRDGEAFVQTFVAADGTFRVRLLSADQIDPSLTRDLGAGRRIVAGVELDPNDEPIAYHVLRDAPDQPFGFYGAPVRVPASDILHVYDTQFPGQVRGLSWLSPVLLKLRDRDEASDAMLMALKVQSLITGFIRDPEGGSAGFDGDGAAGALNVSLEPGAMRVLPPGADVTFSTPGQGLQQAIEFLRTQDREIAAGTGLTAEMLSGDLSQTNYSSARVGILEVRRRCEALQRSLIEAQFLLPLWRRWIEVRALAGDFQREQAEQYKAVRFVPPGWQWVDPRNEVEAEIAAIGAGLKSREESVAARGRDIDELDEERARDRERQQQEPKP
ncbi:phage portal protein [Paenirhodobacter populi]|uniref:Phage portal protein n=1 Tax=Paenirhodobacter populi TaxID=2306993 RepID=A0A443JDE0_9RHOB|nr:phage portal protein [Sinirhodobacter populi]RWR18518.1 phage portal protein [Sinirhodobacter populi]